MATIVGYTWVNRDFSSIYDLEGQRDYFSDVKEAKDQQIDDILLYSQKELWKNRVAAIKTSRLVRITLEDVVE